VGTKKLPGDKKISVNTSNKAQGDRKTKTFIVSLKGKRGSVGSK
jgi:hypothetical protein